MQASSWQSQECPEHTIKEGDLVCFTVLRYWVAASLQEVGHGMRET